MAESGASLEANVKRGRATGWPRESWDEMLLGQRWRQSALWWTNAAPSGIYDSMGKAHASAQQMRGKNPQKTESIQTVDLQS